MDEAARRVTVGVASTGAGLIAALRSLEGAGIEVQDVAMRQPTLDEVFLALTGTSAGGDETSRAPSSAAA